MQKSKHFLSKVRINGVYMRIFEFFYYIFIFYLLVAPFISYFYLKNKSLQKKIFLHNFIFFLINLILFYLFFEVGYLVIEKLCFEFPTTALKENAPSFCKKIDLNIFLGIGWPIKIIFLSFLGFFYSVIIFILLELMQKVKYK